MKKVYVKAQCHMDEAGNVRPLQIMWADGRVWDVDRVLHTCRSPDSSYDGIRYTVLIGGLEKYLYLTQRGWYVLVPTQEETHAK